jgi:hypothetical protein
MQQLSLTFHEELRGGLGWIRTLTRFLSDGKVYGIRSSSLGLGGRPSHVSMTQTAYKDYCRHWREHLDKHPEDREIFLRSIGMACLVRCEQGSALDYWVPDDGWFAVVPDDQWLKPNHWGDMSEPVSEILERNGGNCPANGNRLLVSQCRECDNYLGHSESYVACDHISSTEMYPWVEWGPESSLGIPCKLPKKSDEEILCMKEL